MCVVVALAVLVVIQRHREAGGLQVVAAWVVPTSGLLYGAQVGYPPSKMPLPGWQWAEREPAAGIDIWYHVGSSHYHLRAAKRLDVQVGDAGTC